MRNLITTEASASEIAEYTRKTGIALAGVLNEVGLAWRERVPAIAAFELEELLDNDGRRLLRKLAAIIETEKKS